MTSAGQSYKLRKQRERARLIALRNDLMKRLGDRCINCGSTENLEFDHPHGREYAPRRISRTKRLRFYREDFEAGNLRILCGACNKKLLPDDPFEEV